MSIPLSRAVRLFVTGSCAALLLAGCSSSDGANSAPPTQPSTGTTATSGSGASAGPVGFATAPSAKGTILTVAGRTVYTYDPDSATASKCNSACATTWPPVIGQATAGSGLSASAFGTITRADGGKQVTYDGHPVYAYSGDTRVGDVKGDGIEGIWHVVVVTSASTPASSPAPSTSSAGTGGGYGGGY